MLPARSWWASALVTRCWRTPWVDIPKNRKRGGAWGCALLIFTRHPNGWNRRYVRCRLNRQCRHRRAIHHEAYLSHFRSSLHRRQQRSCVNKLDLDHLLLARRKGNLERLRGDQVNRALCPSPDGGPAHPVMPAIDVDCQELAETPIQQSLGLLLALLVTAGDERNPNVYALRAYFRYPSLLNAAFGVQGDGCRQLNCVGSAIAQSDVDLIRTRTQAHLRPSARHGSQPAGNTRQKRDCRR